jgi:hypothetical protein
MMKLKILTSMAGPSVNHRPGDLVEFDPATATRLIAAGFAEPAEPVKPARSGRRAAARRAPAQAVLSDSKTWTG